MKGELWMEIRISKKKGISTSEIARQKGINWRTAKKYSESVTKPKYDREIRKSKLDDYKPIVDTLLEEAPYQGVRIFEIISEKGYTGQYGLVRDYVKTKKKDLRTKATLRFETLPGKQAQVDWGSFGKIIDKTGDEKKLYCFAMILGYSRMRYIEFVTDMTTETLIRCHINAFKYYGGYPEEIVYDNMKQVVIKRMIKQESKYNPLFEDFAGFYGFKIVLCRPYRPETKGKIERTIQYVENNFFMGLKPENLSEVNNQALAWCNKINGKVHGTTNKIPFEILKEENLVIPTTEYKLLTKDEIRKVDKTSLVTYLNCQYSVPMEYLNKEVIVKEECNKIRIFYNGTLISEHNKSTLDKKIIINREHYAKIMEKLKNKDTRYYDKNSNTIVFSESTEFLNQYDSISGEVQVYELTDI